jgi:hypothetical protein
MVVANAPDTRAKIIRLFTFLGGIYFFSYFVLPESVVESIGIKERHEQISNGFIVVGAMALGLGLFNIIRAHGTKVVFQRSGWRNSLALLVGLFGTIGIMSAQWIGALQVSRDVQDVQMIGEYASKLMAEKITQGAPISMLQGYSKEQLDRASSLIKVRPESQLTSAQRLLEQDLSRKISDLRADGLLTRVDIDEQALAGFAQRANDVTSSYSVFRQSLSSGTTVQRLYDFLYDGLFNQLGSAMFALLGVYIAAAAYRAFRVRTIESALMMSAAVIVMLGQISFGKEIYEGMPSLRQWLLEVPNSAAFRAIRLGAGIAGLMLAIRMWLSIESKSFSSEKK